MPSSINRGNAQPTAHCFSPMIRGLPNIESLLGNSRVQLHLPIPLFRMQGQDYLVGWGYKSDARLARYIARRRGVPFLHLEDGFLRSIGLGVHQSPALSIVIDDIGMYYDARRPSRLEELLNRGTCAFPTLPPFERLQTTIGTSHVDPLDDPVLLGRAERCIAQIVEHRLSKYNDAADIDLGTKTKPRVLVVDQTAGDHSIAFGLADAGRFDQMLHSALVDHPDAEIIVKVHPDVLAGMKRGHLQDSRNNARIRLVAQPANPIGLCEQVDHVYVVTSQLGFEALMVGKPVTCFGAPFYAGWGVTTDKVAIARRQRQRTLTQLFAAAYILYPRYQLPGSAGQPVEIEDVCSYIIDQMGKRRDA
ncbi:MAG: hypothetical protein R3E46_03570 [Sedimenticolaceae bacterium]